MTIFNNDDHRRAYLQFMAEEISRFGVEILTWCLMTNHTHLTASASVKVLFECGLTPSFRRMAF
ncbi:MAG: hypothetical protein ACE5JS_17080, partial [Nitrospinota bacterium]